MNAEPHPASSGQPTDKVKEFLDRLYWIVGTFCLAWSLAALVGVLRNMELDLPVFGKVQPVETIIFTQGAFCVLLPVLFFLISTYRSAAVIRRWDTRFPGVLADKLEIPSSFAWLRVLVFLALVIFPVATMQFCYRRMVGGKITISSRAADDELKLTNDDFFRIPKQRHTGEKAPDPDWRWRGETLPSKDSEPARITAFPGIEPWIYRIISYGSIAVALWFLFAPAGTARKSIRILSRRRARTEAD